MGLQESFFFFSTLSLYLFAAVSSVSVRFIDHSLYTLLALLDGLLEVLSRLCSSTSRIVFLSVVAFALFAS